MTVTLPSPPRLALLLVLIAAVFAVGLLIGRATRPSPPSGSPAPLKLSPARATLTPVTLPPPAWALSPGALGS
jgi:hypothetical protein